MRVMREMFHVLGRNYLSFDLDILYLKVASIGKAKSLPIPLFR